jgi:hypothetical protein
MSHTISQIVIFQETLVNPKSRTRFNLLKKLHVWFVCCLLELDSERVINIDTKKFLFIFVRFCDGFLC